MSQQPPDPGQERPEPEGTAPPPPAGPPAWTPPAWTPPAGWSAEQPPAWPTTPPQAPPPGWGPQRPPSSWGPQPPPPSPGQQPPASGWGGTAPGPAHQPPPSGHTAQPGQWGAPPGSPPGQWGAPPGSPPGQWGAPAGQQPGPWGPGWAPQAPKPGIVPLRPLGIGELLDGALGLIRSNPRTVLGLAATISAISAIVQSVGMGSSLAYLEDLAASESDELSVVLPQLTASMTALAVPALVAAFLQVLASGLFIVLVGAAVLGRRLDAGQTWANLRPRLLALVGVTLLIGLGVAAAVVAIVGAVLVLVAVLGEWAVLPGILVVVLGTGALVYAYVRLAVASPALVMEARSPVAAIRRSWALVGGSWWRVLGILILSAIITNVLATIISVPISMVAGVVAGASESLLPTVVGSGIATLLSGIITLPFAAAVTGLLYTDLRIRREALDIDLASAGVDPSGDPLAPYRRHVR